MKSNNNESDLSEKKKTIKKIREILRDPATAVIVSIVTFLLGYLISGILEKVPAPDIAISDNVDIDFLKQKALEVDMPYMLFNDEISEKEGYFVEEKCATLVSVTNNYDEDIEIQEIIFEAIEIIPDNKPYFDVKMYDSEGVVYFGVTNIGWGDAENVIFTLDSVDGDIEKFVKKEKTEIEFSAIKASEEIIVPYLTQEDITNYKDLDSPEYIRLNATCRNQQGEEITVLSSDIFISIDANGITVLGKGGEPEIVYGIEIDANEEKFERSETISEIVPGRRIRRLPVCFYPDRACTMRFKITFQIMHQGKRENISSEEKVLNFFVSSVERGNVIRYDATQYSLEEVYDITGTYPKVIPYPYNPSENRR